MYLDKDTIIKTQFYIYVDKLKSIRFNNLNRFCFYKSIVEVYRLHEVLILELGLLVNMEIRNIQETE